MNFSDLLARSKASLSASPSSSPQDGHKIMSPEDHDMGAMNIKSRDSLSIIPIPVQEAEYRGRDMIAPPRPARPAEVKTR